MLNINQNVFKYTFLLVFLILISSKNLVSQSEISGFPQPYLFSINGARPVAMAGAYTAIANEPGAIFINPAGIALMPQEPAVTTSLSFVNLGTTKNTISWAQTITENFGLGLGFYSIINPSAPRTTRYLRNPLGTINSSQYTMQASAAYNIGAGSFGASFKYLKDNFAMDNYSEGFALDLGTKFNVLDLFSLGIAINNLASRMYWNDNMADQEKIPYRLRTGIAMEYGLNDETYFTRSTISGEVEEVYLPATKYILFAIDAILTENVPEPNIVFGFEVVPHEFFALRAGTDIYGYKNAFPDSEAAFLPFLNWGLGVSLRPSIEELPMIVHLDYTIGNDVMSVSHNFSVILLF